LAEFEVTLLPKFQRVELTAASVALQNPTVRGAGPLVTFVVTLSADWSLGVVGHENVPAATSPGEIGTPRGETVGPANVAARIKSPSVAATARVR